MTALPLSARLASSLDTLTRPLRRRRAYAQLSTLDDRMLTDIGLNRVDVDDMRRMW
ncbi:DUF1127 domain-containing protein [Aestuariivirga sp.]|uniref:DUF1127 domain-containing protein n=1 Tax=Aestuariivirga sp. TaxID=2650926 RepID=UPI003BAD0269